jgi:hypothetical protein
MLVSKTRAKDSEDSGKTVRLSERHWKRVGWLTSAKFPPKPAAIGAYKLGRTC